MNFRLPVSELPPEFDYPPQFLRVVQLGLINLEPWRLLHDERLHSRFRGLRQRYPGRLLVPFAERQDNDDVACWDGVPPEVVIVHDFASPGWEQRKRLPDFYAWLRLAIEDLIWFEP